MPYAATIRELAAAAGITQDLLYRLRSRHGAPITKVEGKGYAVNRLRRWLAENHLPRRRHPTHHGEPYTGQTEAFVRNGRSTKFNAAGKAPARRREAPERPGPAPGTRPAPDAAERQIEASTPGEAIRLRNLLEQARERKVKRRIRQIELRKLRGELVPLAEVQARDLARIAVVKRGLLAFSESLPQHLVGLSEAQMASVLRIRVRQLLERFSKM